METVNNFPDYWDANPIRNTSSYKELIKEAATITDLEAFQYIHESGSRLDYIERRIKSARIQTAEKKIAMKEEMDRRFPDNK